MKTLALDALFYAGLAAMKWRDEAAKAKAGDLPVREFRSFAKPATSPRGMFDPLYAGLAMDAARLDIALSRRNSFR
jgi:hypothetical protein